MTQRYEEVSNCRLFKVILYLLIVENEILKIRYAWYE